MRGETPAIMRIVVVFPAPLGPRKPKNSPSRTSKSMPATAVRSPKTFVRPRARISAAGSDAELVMPIG